MKTAEARRVLRARHTAPLDDIGPAWVTVEEAFNIDMLAFGCHAQAGDRGRRAKAGARYPWVGYEIKVSRADFRQEMRKPYKRALGVEITHEFYFAVPNGLVKPEEVPEDCGLMYLWPTRTQIICPSPITPARPLTHHETALLLRHGINPGWLRRMSTRYAALRRREQAAEAEIKSAAEVRDRAIEALGTLAKHKVEVGQVWAAPTYRSPLRGDIDRDYEIVEVGERTVKLSELGVEHAYWFPTVEIGKLLLDYTRVS